VGVCVSPIVQKTVSITGDAFCGEFGGEGWKYVGYFVGMLFAFMFVLAVLYMFIWLLLRIFRKKT